jgi:hypothetical protein
MEDTSWKGLNLAVISLAAKHGRSNVSSGKLSATGRWRNVPGKVQISMQSHSLPNMGIKRQFLETSRNGAMEKSSRKGSNLDASHSVRLIVVDLGVDEGDRSTTDVNTSSLRQHSTEGSGKLPSMG